MKHSLSELFDRRGSPLCEMIVFKRSDEFGEDIECAWTLALGKHSGLLSLSSEVAGFL